MYLKLKFYQIDSFKHEIPANKEKSALIFRYKPIFKYFKIIFLLTIFFFACNSDKENHTFQPKEQIKSGYKDTLEKINKYLLKVDAERVENFIKRHNWKMQTTPTGLWYEIYETGNGKIIKQNDIVEFSYKIELLDGTICYDSGKDTKKIKVGKAGIESGVEQGLLFMSQGDKARLIMPPYMAHGIQGDFKKIPARSIVVYHINVLSITEF